MGKVVICVVTYNRKEKLKRCIDSLLLQDYKDFDILIIDNASTDNTKEAVQRYIDENIIEYINTEANLGGAGGFNFAIKHVANDYEYIWIMDDDTYPTSTALSKLIYSTRHVNRFGFFSSLVKYTDGKACQMNKQFISEDIFNNLSTLEHGLIPVKSASFVSLLVPSYAVKNFGLPIKEFFLWGDDMEYTRRLGRIGGYLIPSSVVIHDMENNDGIDIVKNAYARTKRYNLFIRNRIFMARQEKNKKEFVKAYLSAIKQMIRVALFANDHKIERVNIIMRGIKESFLFNPDIEYVE